MSELPPPAQANRAPTDDWHFINGIENIPRDPTTLGQAETVYVGGLQRRSISEKAIQNYSISSKNGGAWEFEAAPTGIILQIGGETESTTAEIVDTRPVFARNQGVEEPTLPGKASGFGVIVKNKAGEPIAFQSLYRNTIDNEQAGPSFVLGRNTVPDLPETVSRKHLSLSIKQGSTLIIKNLEPTNSTKLFRKSTDEFTTETGPQGQPPNIFEGQVGGGPLSTTEAAIASRAIARQDHQVQHVKEAGASPVVVQQEIQRLAQVQEMHR